MESVGEPSGVSRRLMLRCIGLATALFCIPGLTLAQEKTLADRLMPLIQAHRGKVGIVILHLDDGVSFEYDGDEEMPTASLIKFMIMLEVYQQIEEGRIKLTDTIVLREADKVPGSGILTYHFSDGATFPLRDAVRLMIAFSDNTATNLVLDHIGINSTNRRMTDWGFPNSRINAKVYKGDTTSVDPARTKKFGLGSTTAKETVALLKKLHEGKSANKEHTTQMLDHLKKCDDKDKLKRYLPAGVTVAHKSGTISDARTDAGIMYFPGGPVAICVLTAKNEDRRFHVDNDGNVFIGRVAEQVYLHFVKTKK